jgi:carboxyl-terminal processing protease
MPRRNINLIVGLTIVCLLCAARASRHGRMLTFAMNQIELRYLEEVDEQELFQGALEGMMRRLDDYSAYISPEIIAEFQESLDREFGGVGIEIILDPETKQLMVASPLVGTPAFEAGIRAADKILRIDGESTHGLSLADAAERLRGEPGTSVTMTILHEEEKEPEEVEIVRAVIKVDTVLGETRNGDGTWNFFLEEHEGIGYLRINSFTDNTHQELVEALGGLVEEGMEGLILDLRNNPGGMLEAAIGVCDMFIDSQAIHPDPADSAEVEPGVIVTTRRRDGRVKEMAVARSEGTYSDFPIAVLVNNLSASASEIVAACLQDHKRAVVVGQRTFGKGTVQELIELEPNQGMLKLTTASYWRPSGKNIHRRRDDDEEDAWGVMPDEGYEVEFDPRKLDDVFRARLHRDLGPSEGETDPSDEGDADQADSDADPQLARAVEYIEQAVKGGR